MGLKLRHFYAFAGAGESVVIFSNGEKDAKGEDLASYQSLPLCHCSACMQLLYLNLSSQNVLYG